MVEDACSCFGELWCVLVGESCCTASVEPRLESVSQQVECQRRPRKKGDEARCKEMHATAAVTRRHDFDLLLGALSPCGPRVLRACKRARRVALAAARVGSPLAFWLLRGKASHGMTAGLPVWCR